MKQRSKVVSATIGLLSVLAVIVSLLSTPTLWVFAQVPTPLPTKQADITFGIAFSSPSVNPGDAFDVNVTVTCPAPTRGAQFVMHFDPKLIEVTGYTEGNFYKDWADAHGGTTIVIPEPTADNVNGIFPSTGISIMGVPPGGGGVTGSGTFITIHAKAKPNASGVAQFTLSDIIIVDEGDATGRTTYYTGIKIQNGNIAIGGNGASVAQPTAQPLASMTAIRRLATQAPLSTDSGASSIPWVIVVPVVGAVLVGGILVLGRRRK